MKTIFKFATLTLMIFAVSAYSFSATKAENLERGVTGPVGNNSSWSGFTSDFPDSRSRSDPDHQHDHCFLSRIHRRGQGGHHQYGPLYDGARQLDDHRRNARDLGRNLQSHDRPGERYGLSCDRDIDLQSLHCAARSDENRSLGAFRLLPGRVLYCQRLEQ